MTVRDELLELERGFWASAGDGSYYEQHMHDDGRCLLPVGAMDKPATVAAIADAEPWASYDFGDIRVHEPAGDVAVLTYAATATRGSSNAYQALVGTTYSRVDGAWKLLIHQQTAVMNVS